LMIRRETRQIVWARTAATRTYEGAGKYNVWSFEVSAVV
jgi:hypothetical protein